MIPCDAERLRDDGPLRPPRNNQNRKEDGQRQVKNTKPRNLRYQRRDQGKTVAKEDDVVADSQKMNQSFLELIRPMIMDQLDGMMKGFFKEQENQVKRTMKKYMFSQQFKTV